MSNSDGWEWAHSAYIRLLRVASVHRAEIAQLLDSGVSLRRIEALYPFANRDFEQAIVETALASEAIAEKMCAAFESLNSVVYADLLLSEYASSVEVNRIPMDSERIDAALPKAEPRYTELLSGAFILSSVPTVVFLLPKVDVAALSIAAVRQDYAGLMILMGDLPLLELAVHTLLDLLEAHAAATPPVLW